MADNEEFSQMWAEAYRRYEDETGRDLKLNPALESLRTTDDLIAHIEKTSENHGAFRSKHAKLWSQLLASMKPLEQIGTVAQAAVGLSPFAPASCLLGAVLFLVRSAQGVSDAYDCIENLLSQLQEFTGRVEEYIGGKVARKLQRKITAILATMLEIFGTSEKLISRGRLKQYMHVTFLGANGKVQALLVRLEKIMQTEDSLVMSTMFSSVQRIDRTVERTEKTSERTEKAVNGIAASMGGSQKRDIEAQERKLIDDALKSPALMKTRELYANLDARRLKGSGEWIQDERQFQSWMNAEVPALYLTGPPGKIIPKTLSILTECQSGIFFIKESDQQLRSINTILKSIALQIAENDHVFYKFVAPICTTPEKLITAKHTWKALFLDFFNSPQYVSHSLFVVLDGVDEAPKGERETLFELLRDITVVPRQVHRPHIQIALAGRPELRDDVGIGLNNWIEVSASKNSKDIARYVESGVHKLDILKSKAYSPKERKRIREAITEKLKERAGGMFLWVNLMMEQIRKDSRESHIMTALNEAPRELVKMIRHVFERLAGNPEVIDQKEDLNDVLAWVTCAQRPLRLGELHVILKLRPPVGEGNRLLEQRLRGSFASFFTLTREDGSGTEEDPANGDLEQEESLVMDSEDMEQEDSALPDETEEDLDAKEARFEAEAKQRQPELNSLIVNFSHASIRDYLVHEGTPGQRRWQDDLGVGIDMKMAQQHVVYTCLAVLCDPSHAETYGTPNLLAYAAEHLMTHFVALERSRLPGPDKQNISRLLIQLLYEPASIKTWIDHSCMYFYKRSSFTRKLFGDNKFSRSVRDLFEDDDTTDAQLAPEQALFM